jgi:UDP-glucose-4-epimerase GalE
MDSVLVTGGAGYIGSHVMRWLLEQGYDAIAVDDLTQGHRNAVPDGRLVVMSLFDMPGLKSLMLETSCTAVLHLAASASVAESMQEPIQYFSNNVAGTLSLLHAMVEAEVQHLVFASTAAVYGTPPAITNAGRFGGFGPMLETFPILPRSPYGASKAMAETMLQWFDTIHGITSVRLRFFNAAGASPKGDLREEHDPETHLIPLLLEAAQSGRPVMVYGKDYDTLDGTCVRDYVHVEDLAQAHALALDYLLRGGESECFNVGTGHGCSVMEVIATVEEVTGKKIQVAIGPRRPGDPNSLIAEAGKIRKMLGWKPQYPQLHTMVQHAWRAEHTD